jgi:hypothetical protein
MQSVPITASNKHHWEWNGSINLQFSDGEFNCAKCGRTVNAMDHLSPEHVEVADCPVLYSKPEFFKKPKWWLLMALGLELFALLITGL